jgi:hypothetical protein
MYLLYAVKISMLVSYLNSSGPAKVNDVGLYGYVAGGIIVVASSSVFSQL